MDRLNHMNIKQEVDDEQQLEKEEVSHRNDRLSANDFIKQEVDDEEKEVPINVQQQQQPQCNKVKKEEVDGEMKLEWDGDECDCNDCRVERNVKIECNKSIKIARLCKLVKKEEDDDDGEWDEDCFCDNCNRNREKAMRPEQSNRTERQQTNCLDLTNGENGAQYRDEDGPVGEDGESDGEETEPDEEEAQNELAQLVVDSAESPVNVQVNEDIVNNVDLIEEGEQSGDGQGQINDKNDDDQTEIDEEEYEMDADDGESSDDEETEVDDQSDLEPEMHLSRNNKPQTGKLINKSSSPSMLTIQYRIHTGEGGFKCPWPSCNKKYVHKSDMHRHYRIHTEERQFKCLWNNCTKKFGQKWNMQMHYKIHTGERGFECSWPSCNKKFVHKSDMHRHYRIHTGELPFKCPWPNCTKKFGRKWAMQRHNKAHTKDVSRPQSVSIAN